MSRQSLSKAHSKITELSWELTFATPAKRFGTDYSFDKAPKKDPLKQILRSYFPMEEEKDNRVFGAMDGAIRGNMFRQVQERWMEWQKLFLSIIPFPEISAARAMPLAIAAVPNPQVHNGLAVQMIDEVRHSTIQMNLKRLYMNHYIDPAGFDMTEKAFANNYAGTIGRQFGEGFITGDAITAANVYLTLVAETDFTNTLFVAMPSEAAANGDYLLPTVCHSVQSDESRHISNGYSILLMALADEDNRQLLERDLRYAWWNNHCVVDAAIGTFIEYGTKDRRKDRDSYAEMWRRWIYDDYYRSYLIPLEKYGLVIPHDLVEKAWSRIVDDFYVHRVAQFFATGWPVNYWRIDAMTDTDFEWSEHKYPGWYDQFGAWWEAYNRMAYPGKNKPIAFEDVDIDFDENETVLDAAFRQGVSLMHGCKEGQCSSCKSFLLDGDVQMSKYSTFALADYESDEGYVLLCRTHAYSDLEIELINFDEDMIRSGLPVVTATAQVQSLDALTHDITRLVLTLDADATLRYHPGQYVDIHLPGTEGPHAEHRSFSMASPPYPGGQLEFIIKRYPGGRFSSLLESGLSIGDQLQVTGPYGAFTLRASSDRPILMIGGGAGMAPILALLRQMADSGNERPVTFYYGARTENDLFHRAELAELATRLPAFTFVPCLSDSWPDDWTTRAAEAGGGGETGLVTAVLERRETDLRAHDCYLCGPPPMIDSALPLLEAAGVPKEQIVFDKFTITAQAGTG